MPIKKKSELLGIMRGQGWTQEEVAKAIDMSLSRFNAKVWGRKGAEWTHRDLRELKKFLNLSDKVFMEIFFPKGG